MPVDLARIDLNLLHTFRVVVDEGSVARAARTLGRTQPAITSRMHQLEASLGVELFHRAGRKNVLSPAGRAIDIRIREAMRTLEDIVDGARSAESTPSGILRIGALPTVSSHWLAPCLTRLVDDWPQLQIEVHPGLGKVQLQQLLEGELDLVVSVGPLADDPRLAVQHLASTRAMAVFRSDERDLPAKSVSVERLARSPLVMFRRVGDLFFDAVWTFLVRQELTSRVRISVPHIQTLKTLVQEGGGATILPDYTVVESNLVTRAIRQLDLVHPIWMATRPGGANLPAIRAVTRALKSRAQKGHRARPARPS